MNRDLCYHFKGRGSAETLKYLHASAGPTWNA